MENYIVIKDWMIGELGLRGTELLAYAIIQGFSQDGETKYLGSTKYLCRVLGVSRPTAIKVLQNLTEKGLVLKIPEKVGSVYVDHYMVPADGVKKINQCGKETLLGGSEESLPRGGKETLPSITNIRNLYIEKPNKNKENPRESQFAEFWKAYPRKTGKGQAQKAFEKVCGNDTDFAAIMHGLSEQNRLKFEPMIADGQGQYIPYPATWLNGHRWEDDVEPYEKKDGFKNTLAF